MAIHVTIHNFYGASNSKATASTQSAPQNPPPSWLLVLASDPVYDRSRLMPSRARALTIAFFWDIQNGSLRFCFWSFT